MHVRRWSVMDEADLRQAADLLHRARRIVVLTGAGISTDSGIADFRGPNGLWTKNPEAERASQLQVYVTDGEVRQRAWQIRLTSNMEDAQPNAGHLALVTLEESGRLDTLVTQNIDRLHHKAGTDPARIIEIHGNALEIVCLRCDHRQSSEPVHARVRAGDVDPHCQEPLADGSLCGGLLKSATISFGQNLVVEDLERAERAAAACDLLLAVGSTLGVFPAAGLVPIACRTGASVVIINGDPTEMDPLADVVLHGSISDLLPTLVQEGCSPIA